MVKELCDKCTKSHGNGCPIWPTIKITYKCVEFKEIKKTK